MSFESEEMLDVFVQESSEHLDSLEPDLLKLEKSSTDKELVNRIFRGVHSIKGTSGFFGLNNISSLAHVMESVISKIREGELEVNAKIVDTLLSGADKLRILVNDAVNSEGIDIGKEREAVEKLIGEKQKGSAGLFKEALEMNIDLPENLRIFKATAEMLQESISNGHLFYVITVNLKRDVHEKNRKLVDFFSYISSFGEYLDSNTDIAEIDGLENPIEADIDCKVLFSSTMDTELIQMAWDIAIEQIEKIPEKTIKNWKAHLERIGNKKEDKNGSDNIRDLVSLAKAEQKFNQAKRKATRFLDKKTRAMFQTKGINAVNFAFSLGEHATHKPDETIRIAVPLLDDLMNLAGEMVLARNQLMRVLSKLDMPKSGLGGVMQKIRSVTSMMQEKVMQTRLQPIGNLFEKFNRVVRDLSSKLGKEVEFKTFGIGVEIDKSIVQMLSDPLTHMIRNCVDHGIEFPEARLEKGKPRTGTIKLMASHVGSQVQISVWDDGKGMDPLSIKNKAIEKGLITPEEANLLNDQLAFQLVFTPGFSTASEVTEISGRGIGMDVVRANIERLGGNVELDSVKGKYTYVTMRLPLTLAIIPAMIAASRNRCFAVPQIHLEEIVKISKINKIQAVRGCPILRLRDKMLPLVDLATLLDMEGTDKRASGESVEQLDEVKPEAVKRSNLSTLSLKQEGYILVLKADQERYGLIVDELFDVEEVVVKPLSDYFHDSKCYSGTTILGDGKIAMILDPNCIAHAASMEFSEFKDEGKLQAVKNSINCVIEHQPILLFKSGPEEVFAINISMIDRIEKINTTEIEHFGEKEFMTHREASMRLIRLHDYIEVTPLDSKAEKLFVIIPKFVRKPMGILVSEIVDIVQSDLKLDEETIKAKGILGSTLINETMTLFIDVYGLFETVDPVMYDWKRTSSIMKGKRLLFAEDTEFFRIVVAKYLREFGAEVDVAQNGQEAWQLLQENDYDLVLTDVEMPIMNGYELARKIKSYERFKDKPVIALTTLCTEKNRVKGEKAGMDSFQSKLNKESLRDEIERLLGPAIEIRGINCTRNFSN